MVASFDTEAGHKHFASDCFNETWRLLDKVVLTPEEVETMIDLAHASRMHWRYRPDGTARTDSVSAWLLSRVYAVAGRSEEALRYGIEALDIARTGDAGDFYVGFGHEAVARAATAIGDAETAQIHVEAARKLLDSMDDPENRTALASDLGTIDV
jgi:hypothetical protein